MKTFGTLVPSGIFDPSDSDSGSSDEFDSGGGAPNPSGGGAANPSGPSGNQLSTMFVNLIIGLFYEII